MHRSKRISDNGSSIISFLRNLVLATDSQAGDLEIVARSAPH
jgi:hypothetical protein